MTDAPAPEGGFDSLGLSAPVLKALKTVGYETPTPIQAAVIPHVLAGSDVIGQAQTGTGKTAAFALPLLTNIDLKQHDPQVLVLAPTRELAIQVAEAFQTYASGLKGFHVLPIYGGQEYGGQLRQLKRGVHIVVGTPGRVMDHMRRGSLVLDNLKCLVLDEGDEMLRMGFVDDVEWILEQTPPQRQIALFSATMPAPIRRIAQKFLNDPEEIAFEVRSVTADTIRQRFWMVSGFHKLDVLTRILEVGDFDGMLVFVRTKNDTVQVAEKLEARGYSAAPLNGDLSQSKREKTVGQLKSGKLDILVATDVAARGLDVERISHVINYDIPYDAEAYVHRIGRTGRAGRSGEAILFVTPRERRMLREIERVTRNKIEMLELPTAEAINTARIERFKQRIADTLAEEQWGFYHDVLERFRKELNIPALEIAAALASMLHEDSPLLIEDKPIPVAASSGGERGPKKPRERRESGPRREHDDSNMVTYRVEVGKRHRALPGNLVGAIANEANLHGGQIGRIRMFDDFSLVDLPGDLPGGVLDSLKRTRVSGMELNISPDAGRPERGSRPPSRASFDRPFKPAYKSRKKFASEDGGHKHAYKKKFASDGDFGGKPGGKFKDKKKQPGAFAKFAGGKKKKKSAEGGFETPVKPKKKHRKGADPKKKES